MGPHASPPPTPPTPPPHFPQSRSRSRPPPGALPPPPPPCDRPGTLLPLQLSSTDEEVACRCSSAGEELASALLQLQPAPADENHRPASSRSGDPPSTRSSHRRPTARHRRREHPPPPPRSTFSAGGHPAFLACPGALPLLLYRRTSWRASSGGGRRYLPTRALLTPSPTT
nr:uncharacterized protein LOC127328836 [Lolium perenne]